VLCRLGVLEVAQGRFTEARAYLAESLSLYQRLAHPWGIAQVLEGFAGLAAAEGAPVRAAQIAGGAAALRARLGSPLSPALRAELDDRLAPALFGPRALGANTYTAAVRQGEELSVEQAIALTLETLAPVSGFNQR
jgi:hypothetical protein